MISFSVTGSTRKTKAFLDRMQSVNLFGALEALAQRGVTALEEATPKESGLTSQSWLYEINTEDGKTTITWLNTHIVEGVNVAVILQYGHGTGTGGYVAGQDYINPAIQPIFDQIANDMWKVVTQA